MNNLNLALTLIFSFMTFLNMNQVILVSSRFTAKMIMDVKVEPVSI